VEVAHDIAERRDLHSPDGHRRRYRPMKLVWDERRLCDTGAMHLELINFDQPSETRLFEKGRFDLYRVGPATLGRATYEPGWHWSKHVAPTVGTASCQVEHVGLVLSGQAVAKMDDGTERLMKAGDLFYVPPGHDSWVVGDEPYVSLHIVGGEDYGAPAE
jgi:quercetin dioxygenase-like cupin family protein